MQAIEQLSREIGPNTYIIILLGFIVAEKMWTMVLKGITVIKNGNGKGKKGETKVIPCIQNPAYSLQWEAHRQETHDGLGIGVRVEADMSGLLKDSAIQTAQSLVQTAEMQKQTEILEGIRKNGGSR